MSELTLYQPKDYQGLKDLAQLAARSALCSVRSPEDALIIMMTGAELGLSVMQALRGIHVVKGRPVLSADLMGAVVARSSQCEYFRVLEMSADKCTVETKRLGHPEPTRMTWTMDDAKRAGLGGDNWRKYPQAMLRARVTAQICRAVYPDLLLGLYTPEELGERDAEPEAQPVEVIEAEVVEEIPHSVQLGAVLQCVELDTAERFTDLYCERMGAPLSDIPHSKFASLLAKLKSMTEEQRAVYVRGVVMEHEQDVEAPAAQ